MSMSMNVEVFTLRGLLVSFAHGMASERLDLAKRAMALAADIGTSAELEITDNARRSIEAFEVKP